MHLDALLALETAVWQALVDGDPAADERLLDAGFLGVTPTGFGDRAAHVDALRAGPSVRWFRLSRARVLTISDTAVLLAYRADYAVADAAVADGDPVIESMFVSSVWARRDGRWLNVFSQDTPATGIPVV